MNTPQGLRCYAVRRLNPFLGVVQIIETETARASTSNGLDANKITAARVQARLRMSQDPTR